MATLTVGMCVFNAMPYLPLAVESILNQTYSNFKFIIVDDGSTDAGAAYLDNLRDPRVSIYRQANKGAGAAANKTFELCDTELYARMDADDISLPDRLKLEIEYLATHKEVVLVGTQTDFLVSERILDGPKIPLDHPSIEKMYFDGRFGICNPTKMMRMAAVRSIGGYRMDGLGEDVDFILRMGEVGRLANLDKVLHQYRLHLLSSSTTRHNEVRRGMAFALETARCRRMGEDEPTFAAFSQLWENRGPFALIGDFFHHWSTLHYRKAYVNLSQGQRGTWLFQLAIAACLRPMTTLKRLKSKFLS